MRTKNFVLILVCVVLTSFIFIILGPAGQQNDSLKNIVTQTHQQLNKLQVSLCFTGWGSEENYVTASLPVVQ